MSEEYTIETRRRSRSKTPFLRSSCDHENCEHAGEEGHVHHHHHKKKTTTVPNVHTIIEESVEVTSSSSSAAAAAAVAAAMKQKQKTSDYSSEDASPENKLNKKSSTTRALEEQIILPPQQQQQRQTYSSTTTTTTTHFVNKSKKQAGSLLGSDHKAATSTPKGSYNLLDSFSSQFSSTGSSATRARHTAAVDAEEMTQNKVNEAAEAVGEARTSRSKYRSFSRNFGNSFNTQGSAEQDSNTSDLSDHIAYLEYKRAGEYWKNTPKTDYTYSQLSPHRRVLAPGVIAMPNMSRRSLENHHERVNYMIERDPAQEAFIRRRYESSKFAENQRDTMKLMYDSGDEIDYSTFRKNNYYYNGKQTQQHTEQLSWLMRIVTTIVTSCSSAWTTITGGIVGDNDAYTNSYLYRTKYTTVERGYFGTFLHGISSFFLGVCRYIYMFISSILCFDTWLLQSSNAENKSKKRFLLLLLLLLPLLLLAAWLLLDENERLYYMQRTQALVPLSLLASLRTTALNTGATLQGFFSQLPAFMKTTSNQYSEKAAAHIHLHNVEQNIRKALTPEEYENILNHVNSYVQQLVDIKLQEQRKWQQTHAKLITPEQTQLVVQIMRENLERIAREKRAVEGSGSGGGATLKFSALSEQELARLAKLIQIQLEASGWTASLPVRLSSEHVAEIKRLISEQLEVNNHNHYTLLVERIDLDALLQRLLQAPQLAKFIDARINAAKLSSVQEASGAQSYDQQQLHINELHSEIAFIKLALSDKLSENDDLHQSISKLKLNQDDLLKRMQDHELSADKRFSALLHEIELKLAALKDDQFTLLNKQIKLSLVEILGFKQSAGSGAKLEDVDLQNWVRNMFVAKEYLELRLTELNERTNNKIKEEIDRSGMLLMRDISERLKREILLTVEMKHNESAANLKGQIRSALSEAEVKKIVKSVLAIYDADKTGLVDFALESAGGQILSTRCTENFQTKSAQISVFGIPLWYPTNTPRIAISPNVQPGECWAFQGFPGFLVLKLNSLVYVTGFTLEHIPKALAPNGRIDSAPGNFTVWGLEHEKDQEPVFFGEYEYADNEASLQYFPVQNNNIKRPYEIVELRIESNHGHPQYTCLYRFRVHGKPPAA